MIKGKNKGKKRDNHKYKQLIQIRTNARGWTTVEYLGNKNGKIVVRLSDGQIVHRHFKQVKFGVAKKVSRKNPVKQKSNKKYRTKKKRNKINRKGKKKSFKRNGKK